jgi:hypothetical protein
MSRPVDDFAVCDCLVEAARGRAIIVFDVFYADPADRVPVVSGLFMEPEEEGRVGDDVPFLFVCGQDCERARRRSGLGQVVEL